ncbi:MAG TPA: hypothetical protein VLM89_09520 [Phycisphaerae bacterium]|nr:hypothetical protein [Phycisphaerae bacterium]
MPTSLLIRASVGSTTIGRREKKPKHICSTVCADINDLLALG